jgi:hypothetical protein
MSSLGTLVLIDLERPGELHSSRLEADICIVGAGAGADGSVFPTSGWANPTLTILALALALRLGDHLEARVLRS